jgi:phosphopantetheine--protein transferase-like protein
MTGIGNDIVSLKTIDSLRTRSPRFYTKILSPAEQQLYHQQFAALPSGLFVWLLWSIKESAYKCLQRHQPQLIFSPVKFEVTQLTVPQISPSVFHEVLIATGFNDAECFCGTVKFESFVFYTRSIIYSDEVLFTAALLITDCHGEFFEPWSGGLRQAQAGNALLKQHSFNHIHWGLRQIKKTDTESESGAVREFLLKKLKALYPEQELSIRKDESGCPHLFADGQDTHRAISLSHHDGYVGYAFV